MNYDDMNLGELNKELERLSDLRDDTEDIRDSFLGQTGHHVSGGYIKRFEKELEEINNEINTVKNLIKTRRGYSITDNLV